MTGRSFVRSVLNWLRRHESAGTQQGSSAVHPDTQPKPTAEFLCYRLQSLDKMLSDPELSPDNRDLLKRVRSDLELELKDQSK